MLVYGLIDPETGLLRYVGQTIKTAEERLAGHLYTASYGRKTHCYDWVRSLVKRGLRPKIWVIQKGLQTKEALDAAEIFWINYFRTKLKQPLTNHTDGGEGGVMDERTREKISIANKGAKRTSEWCSLMSSKFSGKGNPFFGKKHTKESLRKMSEVHIGGTNQNTFKTQCKHGHEFTKENTYTRKNGKGRSCKECHRIGNRETMRRHREKLKKAKGKR